MNKVITFDDFVPNTVLGEAAETFDAHLAQCWQRIFGSTPGDQANGAAESAGLAVVMMMRAYLKIVAPRPPGNVHAHQDFSLLNLPHLGESIHTVVTCVSKELRRERRYVDLQVSGTGENGRPLYEGKMKLIWAA
jgi:hypothetical protein